METKRQETKYNKIVNFDEDTKEITVLDGIFKYEDGFKGATGSKFEPVSRDEYEDRTDEDNFVEYLIDSGIDLPDNFKRSGFEGLAKAMIANDEVENFVFDTSHNELWDYLREELNLSEDEAYIFNCIGGGRCFDKDFNGNINPELSILIREIES
mgnify:FL=1